MMDSVHAASPAGPTEELTELGKCLLKHEVRPRCTASRGQPGYSLNAAYWLTVSLFHLVQNIYMTLLTLSFTSLSWKDTTNCHRTASMVCWTLLRQVSTPNATNVQYAFSCHTFLLKDKTAHILYLGYFSKIPRKKNTFFTFLSRMWLSARYKYFKAVHKFIRTFYEYSA